MTDHDGAQTSFDPRRWKRSANVATPAPPAPPAAARRLPVAALAGSAVLLLGGALAAWLARPGPVAAPAPAASAATTAATPHDERRSLLLSGPQDLLAALIASGVAAPEAQAATALALPALPPGGEVRAAMTLSPRDGGMALVRLEASNADSSGVIVERRGTAGFAATPVAANLTSRVVVRSGRMDDNSFYSSAVAAGVIDSLIPDFAGALAYDFDFQREVGKGDAFEAAFEQRVDRDGRAVGPPALLYAALSTANKSAAVYRFTPPGATAGWFDSDGRPVKRALLRTPVDAARVSSGFGFRVHPVLGFMKLHKGTDFAAPTGTPVFASGDAVVEFAGPKGPNGNFVKLRHANGWESLYLHMNAFAPGILTGAHVAQGQEIGQVGTTGRSTGPHLHYEIPVAGEPVDPLSVKTAAEPALAGTTLAAFKRERDRIDVNRARRAG